MDNTIVLMQFCNRYRALIIITDDFISYIMESPGIKAMHVHVYTCNRDFSCNGRQTEQHELYFVFLQGSYLFLNDSLV